MGWITRLSTYAILRAAMKTSLARRERRRRNRTGMHRPGVGAGGRIVAILPLFLLGTLFATSVVAFAGSVEVYSAYSRDLQDPKELLQNIDYNQQTVLYDRTGTVQLAVFGSENRRVLKFADIPTSFSTRRQAPKTRPSGPTPASIRPRSCRPCATPSPAIHEAPRRSPSSWSGRGSCRPRTALSIARSRRSSSRFD